MSYNVEYLPIWPAPDGIPVPLDGAPANWEYWNNANKRNAVRQRMGELERWLKEHEKIRKRIVNELAILNDLDSPCPAI